MAVRPVPPFYENWDDTHCAQCVLRGVLEHFEPGSVWTWEELDAMMGKAPGKWTWPQRGWVNMIRRGYDVKIINNFNYSRSVEIGLYEIMVEMIGKEAADRSRELSDLDEGRRGIEEFMAYPDAHICRVPALDDVRHLLDEGYLVGATLNLSELNGDAGFNNHFVLIYDMDDTHVTMHDSGRPARPGRRVAHEDYVRASTSPTVSNWSVAAYKKLES